MCYRHNYQSKKTTFNVEFLAREGNMVWLLGQRLDLRSKIAKAEGSRFEPRYNEAFFNLKIVVYFQ